MLQGILFKQHKGYYYLDDKPAPKRVISVNETKFGLISDNHLCSKYERLDVLESMYTYFELEGVKAVFNCGNWIDGEARFNKHELNTHGMDGQLKYLVDHYPIRKGIVTYAIAGDDHEGWYTQREGVDIGQHAENIFHNNGRGDWVHLGYMEAYVKINNSLALLMHPGGGTGYAISYRPQKIVESFKEAEKPDLLFIGHYHKMSYNLIRGVHTFQAGCTQDQSSFMRKKSLDSHLGGWIITIKQKDSGEIYSVEQQMFDFQTRGAFNGRWNYTSSGR